MNTVHIASFVVRFQLADFMNETGEKQWRIKVTHVQKDRETLFKSIEEAMNYMKTMADNS